MKKLIFSDWIVIVSVVLLLGSHIITNLLLTSVMDIAKQLEVSEDAVLLFEQNPISRYMFDMENLKDIYSYLIVPSVIFGVYYYCRRKLLKVNKDALGAVSIIVLMIALLNFLNDFSILMGVLIR